MAAILPIIHSRWHCNFNELKFSSDEFYSSLEAIIKKREIPKVSYSRVRFTQGRLFSGKREYLRVSRGEYAFDICAAPFGSDFFVSWWFGEKFGIIKSMIARIPRVGLWLVNLSKLKTYYQHDTENMFKEAVRSSVNEALDTLTKANGIRAMSELDRKAEDVRK